MHYQVADLANDKLLSEYYDVMYSYDMFDHAKDQHAVIETLWDSLAPRGELFVQVLTDEPAHRAITNFFDGMPVEHGTVTEAPVPFSAFTIALRRKGINTALHTVFHIKKAASGVLYC